MLLLLVPWCLLQLGYHAAADAFSLQQPRGRLFDQESWASLFRSLNREAYDYDIVEIEGQIPEDLEGVFYGCRV